MPRPKRNHVAGRTGQRAVALIRVSTTAQVEDGSLDAQRTRVTQLAAGLGLELVGIVEDAGVSAVKVSKRDGLAEALRMCEAGEADVLLVERLDRLIRDVRYFSGLMEESHAAGWRIHAGDVGDLGPSSPCGAIVGYVMAAVAQQERKRISERVKGGISARKDAGTYKGGRHSIHRGTDFEKAILEARASGETWRSVAERLGTNTVTAQAVARRAREEGRM